MRKNKEILLAYVNGKSIQRLAEEEGVRYETIKLIIRRERERAERELEETMP